MKIVINRCYGGFSLANTKSLDRMFGHLDRDDRALRTDPRLIEMVEKDSKSVSGVCAHLCVVEIPDEGWTTDWKIWDYDGMETVMYVMDGKIHCV